MSEAISRASGNMIKFGTASGLLGGAVIRQLGGPVGAFADLDQGVHRLRATLMDASGNVPPVFDALKKKAVELGNVMPGTTLDFFGMFNTIISGVASAEDVLRGLGEATANLAVVTESGYEQTAASVTNLRQITGILPGDMMRFVDTLQRSTKTGVSMNEVEFAFSRSAGALKTLGIQGIDAAQKMETLFSILVKTTKSGEIAGSGFAHNLLAVMNAGKLDDANKILEGYEKVGRKVVKTGKDTRIRLDFADAGGKFKGVDNLVAQFEKLKNLPQQMRVDVLTALLGNSAEAQAVAPTLIDTGTAGIEEQNRKIRARADLQKRVEEILGSTNNIRESLTGSVTNVMAMLAGRAVEFLKPHIKDPNEIVGKVGEWAEKNKEGVRVAGLLAAGIGGAAIVAGGAAIAGGASMGPRQICVG